MTEPGMRRLTGIMALMSVVLWLVIFPLYTMGDPSVQFDDGAAIARDFSNTRNIVFTRILLSLGLYITLTMFSVGLRDLICRRNPAHEYLGTLNVVAMAIWIGVTLVANGLEGGIALDTLNGNADPSVARALTMGYLLIYNGSIAFAMTGFYLGSATLAIWATGILPRWTGWLAAISTVLCVIAMPAIFGGRVDATGFYNPAGWGPVIIANFPPLLWFLVVGALLVWKR